MSLNGLDDASIRDAHDAAVAEPGAWFLLKYTSRDEVALLARGNGGIVDIRNSIAQYDESSPLYGFLRYRRRNVLIKYLPEDCSRLVQARVTVHFNAVCDRFAPYDTTFDIAAAKELKDTKLSAACSLHTASGSTSSSTSSLRRRRLIEIAEEQEEEEREAKRQSVVKEEDPRPESSGGPPVTLNSDLASAPGASQFASTTEPPSFVGAPRPGSPTKSLDDTGLRTSSQSARPGLYSYSSYPYSKPKVKLGPRPSTDSSGRPRTSSGNDRLVAALPAGLKLSSKHSRRTKSQDKENERLAQSVREEAAASTQAPEERQPESEPLRPHTSGGRPTTSSGVSFTSTLTTVATPAKPNTAAREKARLKKAMQLREKKKAMALQSGAASPALDTPRPASPTAAEGDVPESPRHSDHMGAADSLEDRAPMAQADSGIDVASSIQQDSVSVDTQDDSHPASPVAASSEIGESTNASSLSESTDETVHDQEDKSRHGEEAEGPADDEKVEQHQEEKTTANTAPGTAPEKTEDAEEQDVTPEADTRERLPQERAPEPAADAPVQHSTPLPISKFAARHANTPDILPSIETDADDAVVNGASGAGEPGGVEGGGQGQEAAHRPLVSKFSTQETRSTGAAVPSIVASAEGAGKSDGPGAADSEAASAQSTRSKRKTLIEPIKTNISIADRGTTFSDDDELQDAAVQSAKPISVTMTPVSPDFPTSPPRANTFNGSATPGFMRTASNPQRGPLVSPSDVSTSSARAVSSGSAYLHMVTQQQNANLVPKSNKIGSSISQRIKALEMLSTSTGGAAGAGGGGGEVHQRDRPSSMFFAVKKSSIREPSRSPSVVERASSLTRGITPSPPRSARETHTREGTPEDTLRPARDRSSSMANRLSMFEGGFVPQGKPDSIQVTARIVRDPSQPYPKAPEPDWSGYAGREMPGEYSLGLKQSPLIVDHQRPTQAETQSAEPQEPGQTILERRLSTKAKRLSQSEDHAEFDKDGFALPQRRSSLSVVKDFIKDRRSSIAGRSPSTDNLASPSRPPSVPQSAGLTSRLSISSRRSSFSREANPSATPGNAAASPPVTTESSASGDDNKSGESPMAGKNRASRFMRRLSSSLSSTRKGVPPAISPTVAEEDTAEVAATSASVPPSRGGAMPAAGGAPAIAAYMGDVNVQFPDNLLWKRRTMCLDNQGFLILSAVQGVTATMGREKQAGAVKRYHLSDFRQPYTPEIEVQELPNSVCLDFVEGSGLQVACEDRAGQMNVLRTLLEAHQSHTSFGQ